MQGVKGTELQKLFGSEAWNIKKNKVLSKKHEIEEEKRLKVL